MESVEQAQAEADIELLGLLREAPKNKVAQWAAWGWLLERTRQDKYSLKLKPEAQAAAEGLAAFLAEALNEKKDKPDKPSK